MRIVVSTDAVTLGKRAAARAAEILKAAIAENGSARLVLSTGASQFETLSALVESDVDWSRVEMFHLDEYIGLPESHPASFRKYLRERFASNIPLKKAHFVETDGDLESRIRALSQELLSAPIDLALIGIGENAHIAFNDPPADFNTRDPYIVVQLDDRCKGQQVGEGWFPDLAAVPDAAVSMSVYQILRSQIILSCVPHAVKAEAVRRTMENALTPDIPATALKTHPNWTLFLDEASASLLSEETRSNYA